ncbi:MAG: pyridoxamine 5'-phosphate oxidase family protein [Cyclobacteriaceae bacterium]
MAKNFRTLTFTESVKKAQQKYGSPNGYQQAGPDQFRLTQREVSMIEERDSFYMATVGENGWPYVQYRGGPKGFLKVINEETIGYADFRGNMQYISTGNINSTKKVSLILLDYPSRKRLKIWAEAQILDPADRPDLEKLLVPKDYQAVVERFVVFHIKAFDWNCPQHISQRFTVEEFRDLISTQPEILNGVPMDTEESNCPN